MEILFRLSIQKIHSLFLILFSGVHTTEVGKRLYILRGMFYICLNEMSVFYQQSQPESETLSEVCRLVLWESPGSWRGPSSSCSHPALALTCFYYRWMCSEGSCPLPLHRLISALLPRLLLSLEQLWATGHNICALVFSQPSGAHQNVCRFGEEGHSWVFTPT